MANASLSPSIGCSAAESPVTEVLLSLMAWTPFKAESPAVGIFRFFLLLVFSNASYPSKEDAEESGCCMLPFPFLPLSDFICRWPSLAVFSLHATQLGFFLHGSSFQHSALLEHVLGHPLRPTQGLIHTVHLLGLHHL